MKLELSMPEPLLINIHFTNKSISSLFESIQAVRGIEASEIKIFRIIRDDITGKVLPKWLPTAFLGGNPGFWFLDFFLPRSSLFGDG